MMNRREMMLLGLSSAAVPFALCSPLRAPEAVGSADSFGPGNIYAYSWKLDGGQDGIVQGVFALNLERMTWNKIADQSDSSTWDTAFRVSHDGRYLAFTRRENKASSNPVDVGVSLRDLSREGAFRKLSAVAGKPVWSPDGKRLMVAVSKGKDFKTKLFRMETWVVNADDSGPIKLPIAETEEIEDWSTDGSWILTGSNRDKGVGYQIYRMKFDGSEAKRLTSTGSGVINISGRISPDGRQIAYLRAGDDQSGIWVMDADGSNPRRIFRGTFESYPGAPTWSPDGRKVAISVHAERRHPQGYLEFINHQLLILDLVGSDPVRIAPPLADGLGDPQWASLWKN